MSAQITLMTVCLMLSGCVGASELKHAPLNTDNNANVILFGGNIITMDDGRPVAEAMLIRRGRIRSLGPLADLEMLSQGAKRVDLKGATVVPGFIDSHAHVRELGTDATKADLVGVTNTCLLYTSPSPRD